MDSLDPLQLALTDPLPQVVLVVDDDKVMRYLLRQAMEQEGYLVIEASNGEQCLEAFKEKIPDIVLLDAIMPVMDGFTCCSRLRELPEGDDRKPILMITGLEDKASVDRAFEVGATDYVTKPIHWAVLRQRVRRLLRQAQLYRQLEVANYELHRLATLDGLTQVANRRRFDEYLLQEWRRMMREQSHLSLILCDIDFFKLYNDTYGHQAGDTCLRQVAAVIEKAVQRSTDLVARYGGEEFTVILPNTSDRGVLCVAELIRVQLKDLAIEHSASPLATITLSLGAASTIPRPNISPAQLIATADRALYEAKASGRDRSILQVLD